jgi:hypothetical protein
MIQIHVTLCYKLAGSIIHSVYIGPWGYGHGDWTCGTSSTLTIDYTLN